MNLTDASIRNPVFAWMLMASTLLFGILAALRIGVSQYPDVDYPNITVSLSWPGASPAAVEREIIEPLEQALSQVEGIQRISSQATQGDAVVTATFAMSRNVDLALQDVQAKVAQAQRQLPKDVPAATVSKANVSPGFSCSMKYSSMSPSTRPPMTARGVLPASPRERDLSARAPTRRGDR